jgi:putative restriction endonuclease
LAAPSLGEELTGPFQKGRGGGPGGWWILDEPELHLGADILVPDLAGWRRSRMPTLPETAFFALAPDWVCWVLSPSTAQMDRVDKLPIYASHGVNHAWLVDPEAKTLEILSLHEGHWRLEIAFKGSGRSLCRPLRGRPFRPCRLVALMRQCPPMNVGRRAERCPPARRARRTVTISPSWSNVTRCARRVWVTPQQYVQ